ncbi:MAG: sulfurtransferase TusA family protein [Burkholderiaceae bacterium]
MAVDQEVDASGLNCPLPILRAKKALTALESGKVLKVISTDPGSRRDFEAFSRQTGHEILKMDEAENQWSFFLKRK